MALLVRQSLVGTTVLGDPTEPFFRDITIERAFQSGTRSETHLIGVQGGTGPGLGPDGEPYGPTTHHAVTWASNSLVFESGCYTGPLPALAHGPYGVKCGCWTMTAACA